MKRRCATAIPVPLAVSRTMHFPRTRSQTPTALRAVLASCVLYGCAESALDAPSGLEGPYVLSPPAADAGPSSVLPSFDAGTYIPLTFDSGNVGPSGPDGGLVAPAPAPARDAGAPGGGSGASLPGDAATPPAADSGSRTSECVPGTYRGAFSGQVQLLAALFGNLLSSDITGTISIHVDTDDTGNLMTVKDGTISGTDQDGNPVSATVNGVFDCNAKTLRNGTLSNGKYVRDGTTNAFTGTVTASYAPSPPSASGTWKVSGGLFQSGGGTWSAVRIP